MSSVVPASMAMATSSAGSFAPGLQVGATSSRARQPLSVSPAHAAPSSGCTHLSSTAGASARAGWLAPLGVSTVVVALRLAKRPRSRGRQRACTAVRVCTVDTTAAKLGQEVNGVCERDDIRNLAIIAHVDHGKTTLTDKLMEQCDQAHKVSHMDSNDLEQERGITILAKNAAIRFGDVKINLIDTPGHADFGGEVERILNMADGCLLLVDAQEGPMPQTKFVLRQALKLGRRVLVCINKVDKPAARPDWVLDTTFDLFNGLGADDSLCDFPVCYASGLNGVASTDAPDKLESDLTPLLKQIVKECPKPTVKLEQPLQMLVANLDYDDYIGRICIGRVSSGSIRVGQEVGFQYGEDGNMRTAKISKLWEFNNNERKEVDVITAGDICAFCGMEDVRIGDTVVDLESPLPLPPIVVDEPTVVMEFGVNLSPYVGQLKSSTRVTASEIERRLKKECMTNLAVRMEPGSTSESFKVKGRGTLQLGILMESMRREGYEIMVGAPQVIYREDPETGRKQEPFEEAVVEVPAEYQGAVMEEFSKKGAVMKTMESGSLENSMVLSFEIPTANLIGMQGKLLQRTRGTAVLSSRFSHWGNMQKSRVKLREKGSIVNMANGKASTYSLMNIQARGETFINPGDEVFDGMCVGIHNKEEDLSCNITKEKAVNNTRAGGLGGPSVSRAAAAKDMSIDDFLGHMERDELLEVTPGPLRLCKKNAKGLKR